MDIFKNADPGTLIAFAVYMIAMILIGVYFSNKSKKMGDYFLAGRGLNSWVVALSAQASDMSGWLLMGLPGAAYISGMCNYWIAIGLTIGTILNWTLVAKRLRKFTYVAGDSITIPEYLQKRFKSSSPVIRVVCAIVIFMFFLVYTSSAFKAGGTLFRVVFNVDESYSAIAIIFTAFIIVLYTLLGGFNAVAWTDLVQGLLMIVTIIALPIAIIIYTPSIASDLNSINAASGDTYFSLFKGQSVTGILSNLGWALGYFGMPHILVRFMAIKNSKMIKKSATIAIIWVIISLGLAVLIGIFGRAYLDSQSVILDASTSEEIFIRTASMLFPNVIGGIFLSAVLASIMSTADSQLLVTASAVASDFYNAVLNKKASDKHLMWVSRIAVMAISVAACVLALFGDKNIMGIVSIAWAGFGAAFGPAIIFSLYWKRLTMKGTVCGIITGGAVVVLWEYIFPLVSFLKPLTALYSIFPGFILATAVTIIVTLLDKKPSAEVEQLFDDALTSDC